MKLPQDVWNRGQVVPGDFIRRQEVNKDSKTVCKRARRCCSAEFSRGVRRGWTACEIVMLAPNHPND